MRFMVVVKTGRDSRAGATPAAETLAPLWRKIAMFNPVISLIGGFRSFYSDVGSGGNMTVTFAVIALCLAAFWWVLKAGFRLKL